MEPRKIRFGSVQLFLLALMIAVVGQAQAGWLYKVVDSAGVVGTYNTDVALDSNGKAHISYYDYTNSDLKYATNASGSWVTTTVDSAGDVGRHSSIAIASNGKVHISYYDSVNKTLKYITNASGAWVSTTIDNVGGGDADSEYWSTTSIALDSNRYVHIGYLSSVSGRIMKYATNASGSWNITSVASTSDIYNGHVSLAVGNNNKIHMSFRLSQQLYYATNASGFWNYWTVSNGTLDGNNSSISVDANGKVHISHYDYQCCGSTGDLVYTTNASGAWNSIIINLGPLVGMDSSIALDSNNKVYISYFDQTNQDLKYATNSSGSWVTSTLDSAGYVGPYTSIAVDSNKGIHISYYDGTNGDLKYAVLDTTAPTTTASPAGGTYTSAQSVTLTCSDGVGSGCDKVYYTTDGSTPTTLSTVYTTPITISSTTTLKFFAKDLAGNSEAVKTEAYTIITDVPASNLRLWLKADAGITKDGSGYVSGWADQSGNGFNVAQGTASKQPLFVDSAISGKPVIRLDGSDDYLQTASTINLLNGSQNTSVFVVVKPGTTQKTYTDIIDYAHNTGVNFVLQQNDTSTNKFSYYPTNAWNGQQLDSSKYQVFSATFQNGSGETAYLNGGNPLSYGAYTASYSEPNYFTVGNKSLEAYARQFNGDIAEVIVYNTALSTTDRQAVEKYLAAKYAITGADHAGPTGTVSINNGSTATTSTSVNLSLTCSDSISGCSEMQFSNDNATWSTAEAYAASRAWTLSCFSGFSKRVPLTISNFQADYQTKITVNYDSDMQADFADLRFHDATAGAELPYWIESKTDGVSATVWIKTGANNNIYMYYGNATATSASNAKNVMLIYEDMQTAPSGTFKSTTGTPPVYDSTNKWVRLTQAVGSTCGEMEYDLNPGDGFVADFQFWSGGGGGADATFLYAYDTSSPCTHRDAKGGYQFGYDEWADQIQLWWNGSTISAISQSSIDNSTWHDAKVIHSGTNSKIYYDGVEKINYTDSARIKTGNLFGWGAWSGGVTNEHRIRNLIVRKYVVTEPAVSVGIEEAAPTSCDGTKTVYVKFKDAAGNWTTATISDTITLDTTPPIGSVIINNGDTYTSALSVNLASTCDDSSGCNTAWCSNNNSTWLGCGSSWTLSSGDGVKTVYKKYQDSAGNWSEAYSDTIVLDGTTPTTTASPAGGTYASAQSVTLTCSDGAGSGCDKIYYTTDGLTPTTLSTVYTTPISISATTTLKFFAKDLAGNSEGVKTEGYTVNIDTTAPTLSSTATYVDPTHVDVTFSEAVNGALTAANYSGNNGLTISAVADQGGNTYRLTTTLQSIGVEYTITGSNITDLAGNSIDNAAKTATFTRTMNSAPGAPVLNFPYSCHGDVTTLKPTLTINASTDAEGDPVTYTFEVSAASDFSTIVATISGVADNGTVASWTLPSDLSDNTLYYWRVLATDGNLNSSWMTTASFFVNTANDAPTAPGISAPANNTQVSSLSPTLSVTEPTDVDIDNNGCIISLSGSYEFEVATDSGFTNIVASIYRNSEIVPVWEPNFGIISWNVNATLNDNTTYYWRARAFDGELYGSWSTTASFFVNTSNDAPTAPVISSPAIGSEILTLTPALAVNNSTDADGDTLSYVFEVDTVNTFDSGNKQTSSLTAEGSGTTSWTPTALSDNTIYYWRAKANDGQADSGWMTTASFFVNTENDAPTVPTLNNPADNAEVTTLTPSLIVNAATDVDNDALTYDFEVYSDSGLANQVSVVSGQGSAWTVTPALSDNTTYWWRARAKDQHGLAGGWMAANSFFVNNGGINDAPSITVTRPNSSEPATNANTFNIQWTDSDPDSNAAITLYYDNDNTGNDGTQIVTGISEDDGANSYTWNTSALTDGTYYIYAKIDDGTTVNYSYGAGPVVIDRTKPETTPSVLGGTYNAAQSVTLTANETATIYYSTDGSDPATLYTGPISAGNLVLKFYAVDALGNTEAVNTQTYLLTTFAVNFVSGGNGTLTGTASQTITYGGSATAVTAVPNTGYHFVNWTGNGGFVTTTDNPLTVTNVTAAQTITANFVINQYTVSFNSNGGSSVISQSIAYNTTATAPTAPTKTGYTFAGWYSDSGLTTSFAFTTAITADTTLYAKWNDSTPPEFTSTSPATGSFINTATVGYTLSEAVASGSITFTNTGGNPDANSPHVYNFTASDMTSGSHTVDTGFALVSGAVYTVSFDALDAAGNAATTASNTNITYDAASASVTMTSPASSSRVNNSNVGYTMSEAISSGNIVFIRTGGNADAGSPHTYTLAGGELTSGAHSVTTGMTLVDGAVYTVSIENVFDMAGNATASVANTSITYDSTSVAITNTTPAANNTIADATVSYTLSEQATSGKIRFTRTSGSADAGSPHVYTLTGADLYSGVHTVDTGLGLVDGAIYTVSFDATDTAGNAATTVSNAIVLFDNIHDITVTITGSGTATPTGATGVNHGETRTFTATPDPGYHIASITGCGGNLTGNTYITGAITANCTVTASFAATPAPTVTYTVTPSAGTGGSISPNTAQAISSGGTTSFTITPNSGYHMNTVIGCGGTISGSTYTTGAITADCSVAATFAGDDTTPPAFTFTAPASNSYINTATVGYALSEAVASGKITFTRTGGTADSASHIYNFTASDRTVGTHTVNTGLPLVNGAIYTVTFDATDAANNNATQVSGTNVTFDTTSTSETINTPASGSIVNNTTVTYALSENISGGDIVFTRTGGNADSGSSRRYTLSGGELTSGSHTINTGLSLASGAVYSVGFENVIDKAGNAAANVTNTNVTYDSTAVAITGTSPAPNAVLSTHQVSYTLSEAAASGMITFTRTGGAPDPNPHLHAMTSSDLYAGTHTLNTNLTLVEGAFYSVSFEATDMVGNPATAVSNAGVFYDSNYGVLPVGNVDNTSSSLKRVDGDDLIKLSFSFGSGPGDANWNPVCDIDKSGRVDGGDLIMIGTHFGEVAQ